jgi:hypothetical protein
MLLALGLHLTLRRGGRGGPSGLATDEILIEDGIDTLIAEDGTSLLFTEQN